MVGPEEGMSELENAALAQKRQIHPQMLPLGWGTGGWETKVLESRQPGRWEAKVYSFSWKSFLVLLGGFITEKQAQYFIMSKMVITPSSVHTSILKIQFYKKPNNSGTGLRANIQGGPEHGLVGQRLPMPRPRI